MTHVVGVLIILLLNQPLLAETVALFFKHFVQFHCFFPLCELTLWNPLLVRWIILVVASLLKLGLLLRYDCFYMVATTWVRELVTESRMS